MLTFMHNVGSCITIRMAAVTGIAKAGNHTGYVLLAILLAALITFALRALPFLIFHGEHKMPEFLVKLGAVLPPAIMAVLVVYCLKGAVTDWKTNALPQLLAVLTVGLSYKWKHHTLLSIVAGTAIYMLFIRIL